MVYPTRLRRSGKPAKRKSTRRKSAIEESRVNPPPEIYVRVVEGASWRHSYARAHLRNRKGYVYLSWRDGERVRELYLGKAPRKSPTLELERLAPAPAAAELAGRPARRVKLTPKEARWAKGTPLEPRPLLLL